MKSFISTSFVAAMLLLTKNARAQVESDSFASSSDEVSSSVQSTIVSSTAASSESRSSSWEVTVSATPSSYVLCPDGWYTRPPAASASASSWIPSPSDVEAGNPQVTDSSYTSGDIHTIIWGDSGYVYDGNTYSQPPQVFPNFDVEGGTSVPVITITATEGPVVTAPSYESGDIYTIIWGDYGYVYEGTTYSSPPQVFPNWDEEGGTKVPVITVTATEGPVVTAPSYESGDTYTIIQEDSAYIYKGTTYAKPPQVFPAWDEEGGTSVPIITVTSTGVGSPAESVVATPAPSAPSAAIPTECIPASSLSFSSYVGPSGSSSPSESYPVPRGSYSIEADPEASPSQIGALGQSPGNENAAVSGRGFGSAAAVTVTGFIAALML